MTLTL